MAALTSRWPTSPFPLPPTLCPPGFALRPRSSRCGGLSVGRPVSLPGLRPPAPLLVALWFETSKSGELRLGPGQSRGPVVALRARHSVPLGVIRGARPGGDQESSDQASSGTPGRPGCTSTSSVHAIGGGDVNESEKRPDHDTAVRVLSLPRLRVPFFVFAFSDGHKLVTDYLISDWSDTTFIAFDMRYLPIQD